MGKVLCYNTDDAMGPVGCFITIVYGSRHFNLQYVSVTVTVTFCVEQNDD
jgi:hypothetical protein